MLFFFGTITYMYIIVNLKKSTFDSQDSFYRVISPFVKMQKKSLFNFSSIFKSKKDEKIEQERYVLANYIIKSQTNYSRPNMADLENHYVKWFSKQRGLKTKRQKKQAHRHLKYTNNYYATNYIMGMCRGYVGYYTEKFTGITLPNLPKMPYIRNPKKWSLSKKLRLIREKFVSPEESKIRYKPRSIPDGFIAKQLNKNRYGERLYRPFGLERYFNKNKVKKPNLVATMLTPANEKARKSRLLKAIRGRRQYNNYRAAQFAKKHEYPNFIIPKILKKKGCRKYKLNSFVTRSSFLLYFVTIGIIMTLMLSETKTHFDRNLYNHVNPRLRAQNHLKVLISKKEEFDYKKASLIAKHKRDEILLKNFNDNSKNKI